MIVKNGTFSGKIESSNITGSNEISLSNSTGLPIIDLGFSGDYEDGVISISDRNGDLTLMSNYIGVSGDIDTSRNINVEQNLYVYGDLSVFGTKNRVVVTDNYGKRLLNAYETPTPYFGDIGSDTTDENGYCKIIIEDIFKETIELDNYKVFIQECGEGHLYVKKYTDYFEVHGTPNLEFDWEIKAVQKGYKDVRLKEAQIKESDKNGKNTI